MPWRTPQIVNTCTKKQKLHFFELLSCTAHHLLFSDKLPWFYLLHYKISCHDTLILMSYHLQTLNDFSRLEKKTTKKPVPFHSCPSLSVSCWQTLSPPCYWWQAMRGDPIQRTLISHMGFICVSQARDNIFNFNLGSCVKGGISSQTEREGT